MPEEITTEVPSTTGQFVRVHCRVCGHPMSGKSLTAVGEHIVAHENAIHGSGLVLTVEGDIVRQN